MSSNKRSDQSTGGLPEQWRPSARNLTAREIDLFRHQAMSARVEDFPLGSVLWPFMVLSLIQELALREAGCE